MIITLKTKEQLIKEGWREGKNGSLHNHDLGDNVGYFSFWSMSLLGREVKVVDYTRDFYIVGGSIFSACYIPKAVVGDTNE